MAYVNNKPIAIHSWGSAISIMAGIHFSLSISNSAFTEYCFMDHPINQDLFEDGKINIENGYIKDIDHYLTQITERQDFSLNLTKMKAQTKRMETNGLETQGPTP